MSILALETSCDDTCAAVVDRDGAIRSNVISSQQGHDRFGGVVPEIASRHHLELVDLVVERALEQAGTSARRRRARRGHAGPGPDRGAARRPVGGQGAGCRARAAVRGGRPPPGPRRRQLPRGRRRRGRPAVRAAVRLPDRERRAHAARAGRRPRRLRGARAHARRRGRRGVRQGRAHARARLPRRRRARAPGGGRGPARVRVPRLGPRARARRARGGAQRVRRGP